jgi:hypothetical protein
MLLEPQESEISLLEDREKQETSVVLKECRRVSLPTILLMTCGMGG